MLPKKKILKGFTAIEITMVATIIAILALIIIPTLRKRTEQAREAAAAAAMANIAKIQTIAFEETGYYFRLMDLDNTSAFTTSIDRPDREVPQVSWNRPLLVSERNILKDKWMGPYPTASEKAFITLGELKKSIDEGGRPYMLSQYNSGNGGGIYVTSSEFTGTTSDEDKIPIDSWGNPYLFFGTGKFIPSNLSETSFRIPVVYSLGPNGVPGNLSPPDDDTEPKYYLREEGVLGTGDDLTHYF